MSRRFFLIYRGFSLMAARDIRCTANNCLSRIGDLHARFSAAVNAQVAMQIDPVADWRRVPSSEKMNSRRRDLCIRPCQEERPHIDMSDYGRFVVVRELVRALFQGRRSIQEQFDIVSVAGLSDMFPEHFGKAQKLPKLLCFRYLGHRYGCLF